MKRIATATIVWALSYSALADDAVLSGGKSPDGHYEVRIYQTDSRDPSDYFFAVVDARTGRQIKQLAEGGGLCRYQAAAQISTVVWHSSNRFFALTDHGTRHSMELYVYEVESDDIVLLQNPNFYQNALGRVDATEGYAVSVVKPLRWDEDLLICSYDFDAYLSNHRGRSPHYTTEFTLRLFRGTSYQRSSLQLVGMKKPESHEG